MRAIFRGASPAVRLVGRCEENFYSSMGTSNSGTSLMTDQTDVLAQLSSALAARTAAVQGSIAAIRLADERHLTGTLWQPDIVVTSEQSLPKREEFELILRGGSAVAARVVGRD